ncbi:hypothetical protein E5676_scaffold1706G00120 [Cucumis melo var. makuwa]|uniref:Uncharacterized protein n=1 Tax=Cucumis melo var. makuwa TaxID=1194695 RepID=A0A5A7VLS2_CUCMM|nr:hypothetical protein E6C27_scaffold25G001430 [Cucumis melo var. makuwa]TYK15305.1 hypothetical protein E5676_scaffold1706G00120 [Cucumis melo var. makuwa]
MQQFYGSGEGPSFVAPPVGSPTHDPISDMMGHYVDVLASKIDDQALDKTARTSINEDPSKGMGTMEVAESNYCICPKEEEKNSEVARSSVDPRRSNKLRKTI